MFELYIQTLRLCHALNLLKGLKMTHSTCQGLSLPPQAIRDAICRALDPAFPVPLSPTGRWALSILLRRVEARNGQADFWVKRVNFSELVDRCDKTVTNWLNELENAGLIVREQARSTWGAFRCLTVRLTEFAVKALQLDCPLEYFAPRKKTSHVLTTLQSKETTVGLADAKSGELPNDLKPLEEQGMTRNAVFKLMGVASKTGVRLSDVMAACGHNIAKATHKYAYIRRLIGLPKDFAAVAAQAAAEQQGVAEEVAQKTELRDAWARLEGKRVPWRGMVVRVDGYMRPCEVYQDAEDGKPIFKGCLAGDALVKFILKAELPVGAGG